VHIRDISRAFLAALTAPRELVHNQAFNVGSTQENYQIRDVADIVQQIVPGCAIKYMEGGGPDPRCYRVNCDKIARALDFRTEWTVRAGAEELYAQCKAVGLTADMFSAYVRLKKIQEHLAAGRMDGSLRFTAAAAGV